MTGGRPSETPSEAQDRAAEIEAFHRLARLLDVQFGLSFTPFRFGLDGLVGLVPGIGDAVTGAMGLYALTLAHRLKLPIGARAKMIFNIALDVAIGAIPVVGDLFDFAFKSHIRNSKIIDRHLERRQRLRD